MSLRHHPNEDMLWAYHRGALAPGLALSVATHVETCAHCRAELALYDAIGGALLEAADNVAMADDALDLALARIERPDTPEAAKPRRPRFLDGMALPDSLRDADIPGRYWAAPGVWMAPVRLDGARPEDKTYLMAVKAGMVMPEHSHQGREVTLLLKGRFSDIHGDYGVGDFILCDENVSHSPAMTPDEDCLCLVWQDAPILPKTWLGKLLQPLARI
jgi:putative transcriptional regulator